jgi:Ca2+-binding EF-hand superfamily protein
MKAYALLAALLIPIGASATPDVGKHFSAMDANQDGKVSPSEHAAGAKAMFGKMDANRDDQVTAAEMRAAHHAVTGQAAKRGELAAADKIKAVDSDGDGVLTADEHAKASAAMFVKMDTNVNGLLSRDEMAAGHAAMMKK